MHNKLYLFILLIIGNSLSYGLASDSSKPIKVFTHSATLDRKHKTSDFAGGVTITQGSLVIKATSSQASQDNQGNNTLLLSGSPVTFSQKEDGGGVVKGRANQVRYNSSTRIISLIGDAQVSEGQYLLKGDQLTYNMQTQFYSAATNDKSTSTGRVTIVLDQNNAKKPSK